VQFRTGRFLLHEDFTTNFAEEKCFSVFLFCEKLLSSAASRKYPERRLIEPCRVRPHLSGANTFMTFSVDLNGKRQLVMKTISSTVIEPMMGWASLVKEGQFLKLTDPRGRQCGDFWAFNAEDVEEHLSAMHTRVWVNKLCPIPGESFHSNHRRPIIQLVADTCGVHDLLTAACDEHRYRLYGLKKPHRSCAGNLREVMAPYFGTTRFYVPQPFNVFANVSIREDGSVLNGEAPSKAGDYILVKAWIDVIIAISACPQEFNPITGWYPTELHVDIMEPDNV
jgi:uncharacterized protein YcgI (DUF1989 family)